MKTPLILTILMLIMVFFSYQVIADDYRRFNEFNMQPEVWHFLGPVASNVDGKGDLNLNLPILVVPGSNGLDFDISFSYKSGILYHQTASWVGLGWNFEPGSITRDVQGNLRIDNYDYGVDFNDDFDTYEYMPDAYYCTLPGQGSFRMSRTNLSNFNQYGITTFLHPSNGTYGFYPEDYRPIKINYVLDESYNYPESYFSDNEISQFTVITENGCRYIYGLPSLAIFISYTGSSSMPIYHPNVWRLMAIAGPDFGGNVQDLVQGDDYLMSNLGPTHAYSTLSLEDFTDWIKFEYSFDDDSVFKSLAAGNTRLIQNTYPRWIITPTHYARFYNSSRSDIDLNSDPNGGIGPAFKKLTKIELYTKSGELAKVVELIQDEYLGYYNGDGKLTLKEVKYKSFTNSYLPGYQFEYDDNPIWDPDPNKYYYDGYGYYNDRITPRFGIDYDSLDAEAWSLKTITYPTGGSETFTYENDRIDDDSLKYLFKSKEDDTEEKWFYFDTWAGSYSCRWQGGVRVTQVIRRDGMGDSLVYTYTYGPGHVPCVPPQLLPWIDEEMGISKNEFHVYKRGDMDVVYEWVQKIVDPYNYEKIYYEISQEYFYGLFSEYGRKKVVFYESPLDNHWMFHTDNNDLFWGIPWDRPRRILVDKNFNFEVSEFEYQSSNRKMAIMFPDDTLGEEFSIRQYTPVINEENSKKSFGAIPETWPYQEMTIQKIYDDTTYQLISVATLTSDQAKREDIIYAHEIDEYGGGTWNPDSLSGMREDNLLTAIAQKLTYYSDLLLEDSLQNCPATSLGDSVRVYVYAYANNGYQMSNADTFFVDQTKSVHWSCFLSVDDAGGSGGGSVEFRIKQNDSTIVRKYILEYSVPPDSIVRYSDTFLAYPGNTYTVYVSAESEGQAKTYADGEVKYLSDEVIYFSLVNAQTITFDQQPCWDGSEGTSEILAWKVKQIFNWISDDYLCEPPSFDFWSGQGSYDSTWRKVTEVQKYKYGKPVKYQDGNGNVLRVYYSDNANNLDTSFTPNAFARDYPTAIQLNGNWTKQFDYQTRFMEVNRITDENNTHIDFTFDDFGRLSSTINQNNETTQAFEYAYASQWNPTGKISPEYPNYIRTMKFNTDWTANQFDYYDGLGYGIQSVMVGEDGFDYNFFTATEKDILGRTSKTFKTYKEDYAAQPDYDSAYSTKSEGYTENVYRNWMDDNLNRIIFPERNLLHDLNQFLYGFTNAANVSPEFFSQGDSVILMKKDRYDENWNLVESFLDATDKLIIEKKYHLGNQIINSIKNFDIKTESADSDSIGFQVDFSQSVSWNLIVDRLTGSGSISATMEIWEDSNNIKSMTKTIEGTFPGDPFTAVPYKFYTVKLYGTSVSGTLLEATGNINYQSYERIPVKVFFKYDGNDNLSEVYPPIYFDPPAGSDSENFVIRYHYNTIGQLRSKSSADEGENQYRYDTNGNLRFKMDARQDYLDDFTYYKYDGMDRITEEGVWPDDSVFNSSTYYLNPSWPTSTSSTWKTRNYYDTDYINSGTNYCIGRLTKVEVNSDGDTDPEMVTFLKYDKMGRVIEKHIQILNLPKKIIQFSYDRQGNLVQTTYPSGKIISRDYYRRNLLKRIQLSSQP